MEDDLAVYTSRHAAQARVVVHDLVPVVVYRWWGSGRLAAGVRHDDEGGVGAYLAGKVVARVGLGLDSEGTVDGYQKAAKEDVETVSLEGGGVREVRRVGGD